MAKGIRKRMVPVDPVYRIPDIAVDDGFLVQRALRNFQDFESDRSLWLRRREQFYLGWDDYLTPARKGLFDGSSNYHLPHTEVKCMAMHARIMQAAFGIDPPFYVDPQEDMDELRIKKVEKLMRYIIMRYSNNHRGLYNAIDDWAWDLSTDGMGILSMDWRVIQRTFTGIVKNEDFYKRQVDLRKLLEGEMVMEEFEAGVRAALDYPYVEKEMVKTLFRGPSVEAVDPTLVLFKGDVVDSTNLDEHQTVIRVQYFSAEQLINFRDSEYFDEDVVNAILEREPDVKGSTDVTSRTSGLNYFKDMATGVKTVNSSYRDDVYEFLLVYDNVSLPRAGQKRRSAPDKLVYYVHTGSQQLPHWNFLDRISVTGKLPLKMAHLYRRPRRSIGRGLVETQYTMNEVSDILVNQSIDLGLLVNNPMFAYRGNSSFDPEEVRVGPGIGIKTDDPNSDIRFFNWNGNPNWALGLQQYISGVSDQVTSLGSLATGQLSGAVGPLRSTSGVNALTQLADVQLDVVIKRAMSCLSELYEDLYYTTVEHMPEKMKISVVGQDGMPELGADGEAMSMEITKAEAQSRVHFGIYANSRTMNREVQKQNAIQMSQMLLQPVALQTGVVTPMNVYEIYNNMLTQMGTIRKDRFVTMPSGGGAIPLQAELLSIMQGVMPPVVLADPEHEKKLAMMEELLESDVAKMEAQYGQVHPEAMKLLEAVVAKRRKIMETVSRPNASMNLTGMQESPSLGQQREGGSEPMEGEAAAQPEQGGGPNIRMESEGVNAGAGRIE